MTPVLPSQFLTCHAQVLKNVSGTINSTASDVQKTVNKVRLLAVCVCVCRGPAQQQQHIA